MAIVSFQIGQSMDCVTPGSNSLLIVEAKPAKSRVTKNLTALQIEVIRRLIYVNQFYKV